MSGEFGISRRKFVANSAKAGAVLATSFAAPSILAQTKKPLRLGVINSFNLIDGLDGLSGTMFLLTQYAAASTSSSTIEFNHREGVLTC